MLRNRGILYGPWLPIYGLGTLGIYALKPTKKHPVLLFFLCAMVAGILEYIIGYIGIRYFGMRLWDYRGLLWNIDGIICFRSVVPTLLINDKEDIASISDYIGDKPETVLKHYLHTVSSGKKSAHMRMNDIIFGKNESD